MAVAMTRPLANTSSLPQSWTRVTDDDWAPGRPGCGGGTKTVSSFSLSCVGVGATAKYVGWAAQRFPASNISVVDMAAVPVAGGPRPRYG